jgi:ABC-2 type transport system ATP-binding protein
MDLLQIVGLEDSAHRTIGNFSAGMRQRLGVALALSGNPQLVFLDEPTSNLDVQSRDQIIDLIGTLYHDSGVSFVINSHVLSELERVCSHIAFIDKGKIIENGEIQTIIQQYTQDVYRIRCSDARKLFTETKQIPQVKASRLVGTTIISITVEEPHIETIKADIKRIADSLGVTLYGIEVTKTLEDAFREAI